jgi:hypothetical protein
MTQVLGVSPAKTGRATLLRLCGYRLESTRIRGGAGRGAYSCQATSKTAPLPTPKSEPPPTRFVAL